MSALSNFLDLNNLVFVSDNAKPHVGNNNNMKRSNSCDDMISSEASLLKDRWGTSQSLSCPVSPDCERQIINADLRVPMRRESLNRPKRLQGRSVSCPDDTPLLKVCRWESTSERSTIPTKHSRRRYTRRPSKDGSVTRPERLHSGDNLFPDMAPRRTERRVSREPMFQFQSDSAPRKLERQMSKDDFNLRPDSAPRKMERQMSNNHFQIEIPASRSHALNIIEQALSEI